MSGFMATFGLWLSVFFTLSIFSFLYKDNPFYKLSEQIFVGLSAAYWLVYLYYSVMVPNLFNKLFTDFKGNLILLIPTALGLTCDAFCRLIHKNTMVTNISDCYYDWHFCG